MSQNNHPPPQKMVPQGSSNLQQQLPEVQQRYEELLREGKQVIDSIPAHPIQEDVFLIRKKQELAASLISKHLVEGENPSKKDNQQKEISNQGSGQSKIVVENQSKNETQNQPSMTKKASRLFVGCNCIKSRCTKNYCECFTQGKKCNDLCKCTNCQNQGEISQKKYYPNIQNNEITQRICNCKKSNCLKKYCQCFNSGVKCNINCKCQQCKNYVDDLNQVEQDGEQVKEEVKKVRSLQEINQINQKIDQIAKLVPRQHQEYVLSFLEYWLS